MNPNSKKPGHLFFTPRTPWGTRAGQHSFRQHQRASEDAPQPPKQGVGKGTLNALKKSAEWIGEHGVFGAGVDKHFGEGEPADKSLVAGVHLGGGEKPEEFDPDGDSNQWKNDRLHVNEKGASNDRIKSEQEAGKPQPQHPGQKMFPGASPEHLDKMDAAFKDSLRKAGIDPTGKSLFTPQ